MKKFSKIALILVISVLALGVVACSSTKSNTSNLENTIQMKDPDQPERVAELYGKVRSIEGNIVKIDLMVQNQQGLELSEEEKQKRREEMQKLSEEERKKIKEQQQVFTGETATVTIPVGIPIKIKQPQLEGGNIIEGQISDIKQGSILTIWLENQNDKNNYTAEYVRINPSTN